MSDTASRWANTPGCRVALYITVWVCIFIWCAPCVWAIRTNVFAPTIARDFETVELLIDADSFPPGWRVRDTYTHSGLSDESWAIGEVGRFYTRYDEGGGRISRASIVIWQFSYPDPWDYEHVFSTSLRRWDPPPPEITFSSQYADAWHIRCVTATPETYACTYSAAYSEFLVCVWVLIARGDALDDWFISPEEINSIFAAQDQRMADFLGRELQEVTILTIVDFALICLAGVLFSGWLGVMAWTKPDRYLAWVRKWRIPLIDPLSEQERLTSDRIAAPIVFLMFLIGLVDEVRRYLVPFIRLRW